MFALKKLIAPFLLPPGIFILILLIAGVWLLCRKNWKFGLLNVFTACLMWFMSINPVYDMVLRSLESEFKVPQDIEGDVIVLLGGGVNDEAPDFSGYGTPHSDMYARIITAVRLQKKLNAPIIISGGKVFDHKKAEAPVIRRFLTDLGVPKENVIIEDKSRDTIENAGFTLVICGQKGFKKPVLVTSAYHMKRSVMSFKLAGLDVVPFPADFKTWKNKKYGWNDYLPDKFEVMNTAIREYIGILYYKLAY
ncbi:MAG: YdcF family protein [Nitrospirae bacterium]|nr:MAG: YdcF family protein [Nitrospirota bacterium]